MIDQATIWNTKAKSFPRFKKEDKDILDAFDFFSKQGISFKDKMVVDIGCGTGRFAIKIAQEAKEVFALDISQKMLDLLKEDAKTYHLTNITTQVMDFNKEKWDKKVDIAFASMTPALNNKESFLKAYHSAKEAMCYIGWGRVRESEFLQEAFETHKLQLELPTGLPDVLKWLEEEKIGATYQYQDSNFFFEGNLEETVENIALFIKMHNQIPNIPLLEDFVKSKLKNNRIVYEQKREIGMACIKK